MLSKETVQTDYAETFLEVDMHMKYEAELLDYWTVVLMWSALA